MARKIQVEYARAAYHVIGCGNRGQEIDGDDREVKVRLGMLGDACEMTGRLVLELGTTRDREDPTEDWKAVRRAKRVGQPEPDRLKTWLEQIHEGDRGEVQV